MTEERVPAPSAPVQETAYVAPTYESPVLDSPVPTQAPAPLSGLVVQAKLAVGPAADPYEDEADAVAEQVVKTLRIQRRSAATSVPTTAAPQSRIARRHSGVAAVPPPVAPLGISRIRRSFGGLATIAEAPTAPASRIQRAATIGAEGGDVDADTEQAIRRSKGSAMPADARSSMEGAFGADFSNVRVHTGAAATDLSNRIQAKAFTTGNDIFFRDGMPDTSTTDGQSLLAHELTHTIQQTGQTQRSAAIMRKWWSLNRKKPDAPVVTMPVPAGPDDPKTQALLQSMGYSNIVAAGAGVKDPNAEPAAEPVAPAVPADAQADEAAPGADYKGKAAKKIDARIEAAKPAAAVTAAGTAGTAAAGAVGDVSLAGGVGGGVLGLAAAGDAAVGLLTAKKMHDEAEAHGDAAMGKQASLKAEDQGAALGMGLASAGRGIAGTVDVAQGTAAAVAEGAAPAAAGIAAGALGVVAGSAMVIQGTWRGGKAVVKLLRLTHGSGKEMLSPAGERWKKVIVAAEQFKVAINALKTAAGALGIAAGALMIAGSPVGWAVGIAAAIIGGAYAASKLIGKIRNARDKMNAHAAAAGLSPIGDPTDATFRNKDTGQDEAISVDSVAEQMGYDPSKMKRAGPQNAKDTGDGFAADADRGAEDKPDDSAARLAAIEEADRIATSASKNASTAAEMRAALADGNKEYVFAMVEATLGNPDDDLGSILTEPADKRLFDAFSLLSAINIDPELALADSGQTLIEQKLSKAEAM